MPRPRKKRIVADEPGCRRFLPEGGGSCGEPVVMTVDEYEAVRLIDLSGMDQSQCAGQMNIARTTAQSIYNNARKKMAQALVYGRELRIEGGDYVLKGADSAFDGCCGSDAQSVERIGGKRDLAVSADECLKIAVAFDPSNGEIFQHFGRSGCFKIYEMKGSEREERLCSADELEPGTWANVLICGGIGPGAQNRLLNMGIRVYGGCSGSADDAVEDFLRNELAYQEDL